MSGGFYKYRCKNFYTYNCNNWVWVNNAPCAMCMAEGRDDVSSGSQNPVYSSEIYMPVVLDGVLQYTLMEWTAPTAENPNWTLQGKSTHSHPAAPGTGAMQASASNATTGQATPKVNGQN